VLIGFGLFRLFDILKPWPIGWLDKRVGGGLGIMLDDLVAGLFAGLVMLLLQFGGI
jgi:phosphatidylglycerophosphatase A